MDGKLAYFKNVYAGRRVFVTGHTGFKGAWLAHWLCRLGARVCGVALQPATQPSLFDVLGLAKRVEHRQLDIRDAAGLAQAVRDAQPEIVFHLAAQALVRPSYQAPRETFETNVGGTVNLLDAIRQVSSVRACVVVTSDKCYENREWRQGYRETDALGGHDPYSASKGAAEIVAASYRRSFFSSADATRIATARAGNVIGGGDWSQDRLVTDFIQNIVAGRPLALRNPKATRPWQHVLEPLSGYLHLAARLMADDGQQFAQAWNFGPRDESVACVETLARALVAKWGTGEVTIVGNAGQPHEANLLKLDCTKADEQLDWRAAWHMEATVANTVAWYRGYYAGANMVALTDRQLDTYQQSARAVEAAWAQPAESHSWTSKKPSFEKKSETGRAA